MLIEILLILILFAILMGTEEFIYTAVQLGKGLICLAFWIGAILWMISWASSLT